MVTVLAFGLALLLSAVTVFLRDVAHFIGVFLQLWFWGTPIIYSLSFLADRPALVRLLELNPMTGIVVVVPQRGPAQPAARLQAAGLRRRRGPRVPWSSGAKVFGRWQKSFSEIV